MGIGNDYSESDQTKDDSIGSSVSSIRESDYDDEDSLSYGNDYANDGSEALPKTNGGSVRKTFYQAHILPKHMLEELQNGGTSIHYIPKTFCTTVHQCPQIEFFCQDRGGSCEAEPNCKDKKDNRCSCKLTVVCGSQENL